MTDKRILDYGYYCDLVELDDGNLRIDINKEQKKKLIREAEEHEDEVSEIDMFPEMFAEFSAYLEFIPDLANDGRWAALTNSCAIYYKEGDKLWWYPNYQVTNIFEKLLEDGQVIFELGENY